MRIYIFRQTCKHTYTNTRAHAVSHLVQGTQCKTHQLKIGPRGNLGGISESEKMSFQMAKERNYALWWLNMFREFQRVGKATEKVPAWVLTHGTDSN